MSTMPPEAAQEGSLADAKASRVRLWSDRMRGKITQDQFWQGINALRQRWGRALYDQAAD